jgi:stage II sporulation protein P
MADVFEAAGIPVLHCTEMFDRESYSDAYTLSSAAVRKYLTEHPSIRIVLDVHRDSIIRSDKTKIRPVTKVNGADTAQFMIVAGTDFKGANHPDWRDNLNFALKIQKELTGVSDSLCRAVNLRGAGFNQQYVSGSLLLEIGSCGNSLTEAKRTAVWAAAAITDVVSAIPCGITPEDILT